MLRCSSQTPTGCSHSAPKWTWAFPSSRPAPKSLCSRNPLTDGKEKLGGLKLLGARRTSLVVISTLRCLRTGRKGLGVDIVKGGSGGRKLWLRGAPSEAAKSSGSNLSSSRRGGDRQDQARRGAGSRRCSIWSPGSTTPPLERFPGRASAPLRNDERDPPPMCGRPAGMSCAVRQDP